MQQNQEIYFVIILGAVLGLLLIGFIVAMLFFYKQRQRRQEQEMEKMKDMYEKEELRSKLEIQENTFKTISQELHDNIGQILSVVKLSLSVLPIEKDHIAYEPMQNAGQMLNKAIGDLSNLTKSLHTDRIAQEGLVKSILFELGFIQNAGIINVQFQQEGPEMEFNDQKAIFLFRMFQEILNNILKHSQATNMNVNLTYDIDLFVLKITDNGKGFDMSEKKQASAGVGLKSLYNRAQLIGATISIESKPGAGTKVLIQLPL